MPDSTATNRRSGPEPRTAPDDFVGRILGRRYRLIASIGAGASAQVYLADDLSLGRKVAVKCLRAGLGDDSRFLRRFRAEAKAAAQLSHPNLLAVYDWGEDASATYFVTEVLLGGSLLDVIERSPRLTPSQGLLVALQVAQGLNYAHELGWVHRDIKPANLLFGEEGRLRIADFGIARAVAEAAWTEPEGILVGTARYAAPEQAESDAIDGKADVYSLALTVIEAVTGQVPLLGESALATLVLRQDRDVDRLDELGPLADALGPAGRADPARRPSAGELIEALTTAARSLPRPRRLPLSNPRLAHEPGRRRPARPGDGGPAGGVIDLRDGGGDAGPPRAPEGGDDTEVEGHQLRHGDALRTRPLRTPSTEGGRPPALRGPEDGVTREPGEGAEAIPDMTIIERPVPGFLTPPSDDDPAVSDSEPAEAAVSDSEPTETAMSDTAPVETGTTVSDTAPMETGPGNGEPVEDAMAGAASAPSTDPADWPPPPFPGEPKSVADRSPRPARSDVGRHMAAPVAGGSWLDQSKIVPEASAEPPGAAPAAGAEIVGRRREPSAGPEPAPPSQRSSHPEPSFEQAQRAGATARTVPTETTDERISDLFADPVDEPIGGSEGTGTGGTGTDGTGTDRSDTDGSGSNTTGGGTDGAGAPAAASGSPEGVVEGTTSLLGGSTSTHGAIRRTGPRWRGVGRRPRRHRSEAPPRPVRWTRVIDADDEEPPSRPAMPVRRTVDLPPASPTTRSNQLAELRADAAAVAVPAPTHRALDDDHDRQLPEESSRSQWLPLTVLSVLIVSVLAVVIVVAVRTDDDLATSGPRLPPAATVGDYVGQPVSVAETAADRNNWLLSITRGRQRGTAEGMIIEQEPAPGTELRDGDRLSVVVSLGPQLTTVPSVVGRPLDEAVIVLRQAGLEIGVVIDREDSGPEGQVLGIEVGGDEPDSRIEVGTAIDVIVSAGASAQPMPSFVGLTVDQAIDQANELGLALTSEEAYSERYDEGFVVHTEPPTDALVKPGDPLTIVVSAGLPFITVPDVAGLDVTAAGAELTAAGFAVGETVGPADQPVLQTSPPAGEAHRKGRAITLITGS